MLSLSIGLNAVSSHGACTAVFVAVAAIIGFVFSSIRTLGKISLLAWFGLFCIITASKFDYRLPVFALGNSTHHVAVMIVTIAVGIQDRPSAAPQEGPWSSDYQLFKQPTFAEAVSSVSTMVFAYGGTVGFFSIAAEMRDPRLYKRSLLVCQGSVTALYVAIGVVVYYYCGSFVTSPALGSAGPLLKKIAYGFALPGLAMTTILVTHVSPRLPSHRNSCANVHADARQVHFCPHSPRNEAPYWQHPCPLGDLAGLHLRCEFGRIPHRKWHTRFRQSCISRRGLARLHHGVSADGCHVVLRQLEQWEERATASVGVDGLLVCFCYCWWYFPDGFRHVRRHSINHRLV